MSTPNPIVVEMEVAVNNVALLMEVETHYDLPVELETLTATANTTYHAPAGTAWDKVNVAVPGPSGSVTLDENGTFDVTQYAEAVVDVPNSYTAADEGKVVSDGALVAQTARTVTENGTFDTTLNNSVTVDVPTPDPDVWVRPSDWPDLDSIIMPEDTDIAYMTYDMRKTPGYGWIGVWARTRNSAPYYLSIGTISNGQFVATETFEVQSNARFQMNLRAADGDIQLWKLHSTSDFTDFAFKCDSDQKYNNALQPCVEFVAKFQFVSEFSSNISNTNAHNCRSTNWVEHYVLSAPAAMAITGLLQYCSFLQKCELEFGNSLTLMTYLFFGCSSLKKLDLRAMNVSAVTSFGECFNYCAGLKYADISGWDMESASSASGLFGNCRNLITLKARNVHFPTNINIYNWNAISLQNVDITYLPEVSSRFDLCRLLTKDSLLNIIDALPETTATLALTLGASNKNKLTAAEIAVATEKGWTVA